METHPDKGNPRRWARRSGGGHDRAGTRPSGHQEPPDPRRRQLVDEQVREDLQRPGKPRQVAVFFRTGPQEAAQDRLLRRKEMSRGGQEAFTRGTKRTASTRSLLSPFAPLGR